MGKQVYCVTLSDKNDKGKNLAEASNSCAYHHMGELVDVDDDQSQSAPERPFATERSTGTWPSAHQPSGPAKTASPSPLPYLEQGLPHATASAPSTRRREPADQSDEGQGQQPANVLPRGGFADTEIAETNRQHAMAEKLRKSNRIQRRPAVDTSP